MAVAVAPIMRLIVLAALAALVSTLAPAAHADEPPPPGMVEIASAPAPPRPVQIASAAAPPGMVEIASAPAPPGMVEVPNGATFERPRNPPSVPRTKQRSLFIAGSVMTGVGGLVAVIGGAVLISSSVNLASPACAHDFGCNFPNGLGQGVGELMLSVGGPPLIAGITLMVIGSRKP